MKFQFILGWQTISPQNMVYKNRMHQIRVNLVDILEIDTDKRYKNHFLIEEFFFVFLPIQLL